MNLHVESTSVDQAVIVMSRTFAAPRELVWATLTDPKHVAQWYGGHGFSNPVCEMDVRPGGLWKHVMRTPDGSEFPMTMIFVEVRAPELLVWQSSDWGKSGPTEGPHSNHITVTLEELGARQTKWTLVSRFTSLAARDQAARMGFASTLEEGLEKFESILRAIVS